MAATQHKFPLRATMAGFHRFTVDEYHRLIEVGILTENDDLELIDGYLVEKLPHDPIHDGTIQVVEDALRQVLTSGWCIRVQSVVTLSRSEPEPVSSSPAATRGLISVATRARPTSDLLLKFPPAPSIPTATTRFPCTPATAFPSTGL